MGILLALSMCFSAAAMIILELMSRLVTLKTLQVEELGEWGKYDQSMYGILKEPVFFFKKKAP